MVILYTCVIMDRKIMAEYPTGKKDMMQLINNLLEYIPNREHKKSLNYESKNLRIHYECMDEDEKEPTHRYFTIISVTDEMTPYRVVFGLKSGFFKDLQKEVRSKYTKGARNQKNSQLRSYIQQKMTEWNDPNKDKLTHLGYEISKNKSKMIENIDKILHNHETMGSLMDRTALLVDNSDHFQKQAKKLKSVVCWNNFKLLIILVVVLAVIAFIGIWLGCGFPDFKRCAVGDNTTGSDTVV